ncbi:MAG: hypothetical protein ACPG4T_07640 [Nannocystaceae bacterium]
MPNNPSQVGAPTTIASWERWFVGLFCCLVVCVPINVGELYPFSLPSMFSRAPRVLAKYRVRGPDGAKIPLIKVHLHVQEWHDPPARGIGGTGYGRRRPPSAHQLGEVASREDITRAVRWSLAHDDSLPHRVLVHQQVHGRGPDGAVITVSEQRWWIERDPR